MNVQRHQRIEQIKKLSEYLRRVLTLAGYFLWLGWPMALLIPFFHSDDPIMLHGNIAFKYHELPLTQRLALSAGFCVLLLLTQYAVRYARDLMEHFSEGEIFNRSALDTARKAIHFGMAALAGDVLADMFVAGYLFFMGNGLSVSTLFSDLCGSLINGFLFFGLMFVLLWALEIGMDLNEESELTI